MASALAVARPAALSPRGGSKSITGNLPMLPAVPSTRLVSGRMRSRNVVAAKAAQDSSEPSSGSVVKYVQSSFSTPEDLFALAGIGFAGIAALWASINLVEVIDKLPVLPLLFELIGILVAWGKVSEQHQEFRISSLGAVILRRKWSTSSLDSCHRDSLSSGLENYLTVCAKCEKLVFAIVNSRSNVHFMYRIE
uniref:Cyanobacterial aminoacyl-tRNA synthetase CAAD domain-containing protein n=1 Tax=Oryza meridionalis TaxID=40149 RepID=A0A0E0C807_9ORYZ